MLFTLWRNLDCLLRIKYSMQAMVGGGMVYLLE